jgi:kynurenine formamidase
VDRSAPSGNRGSLHSFPDFDWGCSMKLFRIGFGFLGISFLAAMTLFGQNAPHDDLLANISNGKTQVIDLTYAINDKLVPWPGDKRFFEAKDNATVEKDGLFTRSFWMLEHYGTHLDAPIHFPPGKTPVDKIPVKQFFGPAVVIDVQSESAKNADYLVDAAHVETWEKRHGKIPAGAIVLLRTGWASRWPDVKRYRNQDALGKMHFPGFSDRSQGQRIGMRYAQRGLRGFIGLCGAPSGARSWALQCRKSR